MASLPLDLRDKRSSKNEHENQLEQYVQTGKDEGELSPLLSIPSPELRKSIFLKFVEIDPEVLMTSLSMAPQLEALDLIDVDFTFTPKEVSASFSINQSLRSAVSLPNLKSYRIRTGLNTELGEYNRKDVFASWIPFATPTPIESLFKGPTFEPLVKGPTFESHVKGPTFESHVKGPPLNFDFFGKDDGTIFSINHDSGEIQSRLRWTNDILKALPPSFACSKLVVFFCCAELDVRAVPSAALQHLELTATVFRHGVLSDLLRKASHLSTLYLDGVHNEARSDDPGALCLHDLGHLPDLSALWLDHMVLSYSPNVTLGKVRELVLDSRMESIDSDLIDNFVRIFPRLETVALVMHNVLVNHLLEKILGLHSIQKIFLKTQYIRERASTWQLIESEQLKSILLEINPEDDQYFTLCKLGGTWTGGPVDAYGPFLKDFLTTPFVAFWD